MTKNTNDQARFTHDRWQAGRLRFPDGIVVDVVVVEERDDEDLRAIARYRTSHGMVPDLGPVMTRAIRSPVDGEPHLPAVVRVGSAELAAEVRRVRPDVKLVIGPTPLVEELGRDFAEQLLPRPEDKGWRWLGGDVTAPHITRLFAAFKRFAELAVWEAVPQGQLVRVTAPKLGLDQAAVLVLADPSITGGQVISIAIAPDAAAAALWEDDESSDREIEIYAAELDDLSDEALAEAKAHGWEPAEGYYPRVTAGGEDERAATAAEVTAAAAVLEAVAEHFARLQAGLDPFAESTLTLADGVEAVVAVHEDDEIHLRDGDEDDDDEDDDDDDDDDEDDEDDEDDDDDDADDDDADDDDADDDEIDPVVAEFLKLDDAGWPAAPEPQPATVRAAEKPGRNDPCSCGSGIKYKKCHGK
ncbi:MAG: SEC-C domain-containing protein [Deltaproteobacteria bacterium]|nr:SEC-C domain-containing protein [Deltaproteobacteria bacterium]